MPLLPCNAFVGFQAFKARNYSPPCIHAVRCREAPLVSYWPADVFRSGGGRGEGLAT